MIVTLVIIMTSLVFNEEGAGTELNIVMAGW